MTIQNPVTAKPVTIEDGEEVLAFVDSSIGMIDAGLHSPNGESLATVIATDEAGKRTAVLVLLLPGDNLAILPLAVLLPYEGDFGQSDFIDPLMAKIAEAVGANHELTTSVDVASLADLTASIESFRFVEADDEVPASEDES